MLIDYLILVGLAVSGYLNWKTLGTTEELEEVVAHMLMDLGEKGILKVEVTEDA